MRSSMKYSHLFATIIVLVNGTAAQDLGNKYTKFVPMDYAASGQVTWSDNGTSWNINEMYPDAPADSKLGYSVKACVGSMYNSSDIAGVQAWYGSGDNEEGKDTKADTEYCITGWEQHGCMGKYAYMSSIVKPIIGKQTYKFEIDPLPKAVSVKKGGCPAE